MKTPLQALIQMGVVPTVMEPVCSDMGEPPKRGHGWNPPRTTRGGGAISVAG